MIARARREVRKYLGLTRGQYRSEVKRIAFNNGHTSL